MTTAEINKIIDNARDILVGRIPNPQSQIEFITMSLIYKFMDDMDIAGQRRVFFVGDMEQYAFSKIMDSRLGAQQRLNLFSEALEKLPFAKSIPDLFRRVFKDASLTFRDPSTLTMFLREIAKIDYDNSENLGNAFEHLLSVMGAAGAAGMFRTPRHIIDFIVDVVQPNKDDTILDPACGTAGFLISAYLYIKKNNPEMSAMEIRRLTENITGYDISPNMVRLATVNMYLHRFNQPKIYEYDSLGDNTRWDENFDCILANPPFMTPTGGIIPHSKFRVNANHAEVLFVDYIAEHLNMNGRAGIVVPEGIIFNAANAYKALRKMLVDDNYLYAVVSLPSGVFNPYTGVKTSILFFDRKLAKEKKDILFIRVDNDGFDLGARRSPIKLNDLPFALETIEKWKKGENVCGDERVTIVSKEDIAKNDNYDLTAGRYIKNECAVDCQYKMVKLGEVCEILDSKRKPITKSERVKGKYPYYGATGELDRVDGYLFDEPLVLLGEDGARWGAGETSAYTISGKTWVNNHAHVLRPKRDLILDGYLVALLNSLDLSGFISGITVPKLNQKNMKNIEIPLPPMDVQKQIVAEIENKQSAIDNAREIIRNLERESSYFASLLDGLDYETVDLGSIAEIISGQSPEGKFYNQVGEGVAFYQGRTEFGDVFIKEPKTWTTQTTKLAIKNDILMSVRAPVGPVNMLGFDEVCIGRGLAAIRVDSTKAVIPYVYGYLKSIENTITGNGGAIFDSINRTQIAELKIPLPSLKDQQRIVEILDREQSTINSLKALIGHLTDKINAVIARIYKQ